MNTLSFEYLYNKYKNKFNIPQEILEDCIQDSYYKFYKTNPKDINLEGWFYITIRNSVIDKYRKQNNNSVPINETIVGNTKDSEDLTSKEMLFLLDKINPKFKDVLYDYYYLGFSLKEMAEVYNVSINTIKSRMRLGKIKLKELYNDFYS